MKTISQILREGAERSHFSERSYGVVIEPRTAQAIADMLDHAWEYGGLPIKLHFANHDQGYADRLIAERRERF